MIQFKSSLKVGPASGWFFYKVSINPNHLKLLTKNAKFSALEVNFDLNSRFKSLKTKGISFKSDYLSIHLPSFKEFKITENLEQKFKLGKVCNLVKSFNANMTTLHPDTTPVEVIKYLYHSSIPMGFENMDVNKNRYTNASELSTFFKKWNTNSVLDLQHAYEISKKENVSIEFYLAKVIDAMNQGKGISHIHLSGETFKKGLKSNHALLTESDNTNKVLAGLAFTFDKLQCLKPIILEGDYISKFSGVEGKLKLSEFEIRQRASIAKKNLEAEVALIDDYIVKNFGEYSYLYA